MKKVLVSNIFNLHKDKNLYLLADKTRQTAIKHKTNRGSTILPINADSCFINNINEVKKLMTIKIGTYFPILDK